MSYHTENLSSARYEEFPLLSSYGTKELSAGEVLPLGYHQQIEMKLFLSEGAEVECEGVSYIAQAGDVFVFNPNERHASRWLYGTPRYQIIMLAPNLLHGAERSLIDTVYLQPYIEGRVFFRNCIRGNDAVRRALSELYNEMEQKRPGYELMVQGILYQLFAHLFRDEVQKIVVPGELETFIRRQKKFDPIYSYISRNYSRHLSLEELARECHLSENRFSVLFHELTGTSPVQYINRYRVEKAKVLLKTTNLPVAQVAEVCGFSDAAYFCRCYRKLTGYSPKEERKSSNPN